MINILINKKEAGIIWTRKEIESIVHSYCNNLIDDHDMGNILKCIVRFGMNFDETYDLTMAMLNSGDKIYIPKDKVQNRIIIDKHSTGAVGDTISLIMIPLLASLGFVILKMSGKSLGNAGGTIDKLESIPNFLTKIKKNEIIANLEKNQCVMVSQTEQLVPADMKIYNLRNKIGAIDSIPLIASSIMSKKLAVNSDYLILEVTYGKGAFMKSYREAYKLANLMIKIGRMNGKSVSAAIIKLDEPIGLCVGNAIEVYEAYNFLNNKKASNDLAELTYKMTAEVLMNSKRGINEYDAYRLIHEEISSGNALNYFEKMIKLQNGNIEFIKDFNKLTEGNNKFNVCSDKKGYICDVDAEKIGEISNRLAEEFLYSEIKCAGILMHFKLGEKVEMGDTLFTVYSPRTNINDIYKELKNTIVIKKSNVYHKNNLWIQMLNTN